MTVRNIGPECVKADAIVIWRAVAATGLLDALRNCWDIMPSALCDDLNLPHGSTYAGGVHEIDLDIELMELLTPATSG